MYFFDSWQGLPERWELVPVGNYAANVPDFRDGRALLVKGWFEHTVPGWAATQSEPLGLVHMDADLYSSTMTVLEHLNKLIVPGTVILFDEYYNYGSSGNRVGSFVALIALSPTPRRAPRDLEALRVRGMLARCPA